jgi:hypothetical protein
VTSSFLLGALAASLAWSVLLRATRRVRLQMLEGASYVRGHRAGRHAAREAFLHELAEMRDVTPSHGHRRAVLEELVVRVARKGGA